MSKTVDLVNSKTEVQFGLDTVVIQKYISGIKGGRVLDVTGYSEKNILAGHVVILTADGEYAPMPISEGKYGTLPEGATYVGVVKGSIPANKPAASIMTWGEVNKVAMPYQFASEDALKAFKVACPHIDFIADIEG